MASSKSQLDLSSHSLQSIPPQSPTFNQQRSSQRLIHANTQHSLISPKTDRKQFSPRRTVLKFSARANNESNRSILRNVNAQREETSRQVKVPEEIISPFPLQRFALERKTSDFVVVLLKEIRNLSLRSVSPTLQDHSKEPKPKLDVEAILANMKEISTIAPHKTDRSPETCHSMDVARNTLEEVLEIPLDHLSTKEQAKLRKKRHTPSILSFLDKQFPPRLAYRRKSCCCTWCGGVHSLQRDIEGNPWVSLLTGWEEHAANRKEIEDAYKKEEPIIKKKKARGGLDNLLSSATKKIIGARRQGRDTPMSQAKGISFRDLDESKGIMEATEGEERTPSVRNNYLKSSKKLKTFLGGSPKTTTAAMGSFRQGKTLKINLQELSRTVTQQQLNSGSNSMVFDRNENELKSAAVLGGNRDMKTWNNVVNKEQSHVDSHSSLNRSNGAVSSLYATQDRLMKPGSDNDNRFLGGYFTTRSKDSQSIKTKKDSIFSREHVEINKAVNFSEAIEKNRALNGLVSPKRNNPYKQYKQEESLKDMMKTSPVNFNMARKVIRVNVNKNKTEREQSTQREVKEKETKEKDLKKDIEDRMLKKHKLKSIKSRNKEILHVYLSTSMRSPSQSGASPRILGYTQFPDAKDLSFMKEGAGDKEKRKERGNIKLRIRKVEEKSVRDITENSGLRETKKKRKEVACREMDVR